MNAPADTDAAHLSKTELVQPTPPEVITTDTLRLKYGYSLEGRSDKHRACRIESAPEFVHYKWKARQLLKRRGIAFSLPFTATLDLELSCAH
jgi:hypothetical protein